MKADGSDYNVEKDLGHLNPVQFGKYVVAQSMRPSKGYDFAVKHGLNTTRAVYGKNVARRSANNSLGKNKYKVGPD